MPRSGPAPGAPQHPRLRPRRHGLRLQTYSSRPCRITASYAQSKFLDTCSESGSQSRDRVFRAAQVLACRVKQGRWRARGVVFEGLMVLAIPTGQGALPPSPSRHARWPPKKAHMRSRAGLAQAPAANPTPLQPPPPQPRHAPRAHWTGDDQIQAAMGEGEEGGGGRGDVGGGASMDCRSRHPAHMILSCSPQAWLPSPLEHTRRRTLTCASSSPIFRAEGVAEAAVAGCRACTHFMTTLASAGGGAALFPLLGVSENARNPSARVPNAKLDGRRRSGSLRGGGGVMSAGRSEPTLVRPGQAH